MQALCTKCFGKGLCGRVKCPIQSKIHFQKNTNFQKDFQGQSPNIFIGRFNYPNVNIGILSTKEEKDHDNPKKWIENNFSIDDIIQKRVSLVNSSFTSTNQNSSINNRLFQTAKEVSLSIKSNDLEINLEDKPKFKISFNQDVMPFGPRQNLKKATITSNSKIPFKVEKLVDDKDISSTQSLSILYKKGFDENYLTKVFSLGNLGYENKRKIVPTRWSITATDDILGTEFLKKIRTFEENSEYFSYFGGLKGNYYLVLFFPGNFSYELFETYLPNTIWNNVNEINYTTDYEEFNGRKTYAQNTSGGYYAARLPVLEYLIDKKIQARVLVIRLITPKYYAPLGVWYCREAVRNSLNNKKINFHSKEYLLKYVKSLTKKNFNLDIDKILNKSKLLKEKQLNLRKFLSNK